MLTHSDAIARALRRAMEEGLAVKGSTSPNPPVGAVVLDASGEIVGAGGTQPPGGPHAEVMALRAAGHRARGGTAVVTLEPCNHTGRTGPCAQALIEAGVARVLYLHEDPNVEAAGGAATLAAAGVEAVRIEAAPGDVEDALIPWLGSIRRGRPHVTLKFAQTLDGFTAATDLTSQWITGAEARAFVHEDRARRDAIVVGTGTVLQDNPSLTARFPDGSLRPRQPRRVVIGGRPIAEMRNVDNLPRLGYEQYPTIDAALAALWDKGCRDVLVEGGASLALSFLHAGSVDAIQAYIGAKMLGRGQGVVSGPLALTMSGALPLRRTGLRACGDDVLLTYAVEANTPTRGRE